MTYDHHHVLTTLVRILPAHLTLFVGRLPSVAVLKECSLVGALLLHVLDQLLVPDLLAEVPQVAGDDLQVIPGVPGQAGLGRVDSIESALKKSNQNKC